jgi:hypothetical protein
MKNEEEATLEGSRQPASDTEKSLSLGIDIASMRLDQSFTQMPTKKALNTVPFRRPNRHEFIRVQPGDEQRLLTMVLDHRGDREKYILHPSLWGEWPEELKPNMIVTAINRQGVTFLWPLRWPHGEDTDRWMETHIEACQRAESEWVRIASNMDLGAYECFPAKVDLDEPVWPEEGFERLFELAVKDRFINDQEHPVLRMLRGEL